MKLLDSYLQPSQSRELAADSRELRALCEFLAEQFFALATYTCQAISRSIGCSSTATTQLAGSDAYDVPVDTEKLAPRSGDSAAGGALRELDLLLPKVCEALVLVTQCLTSLSLISEEGVANSRDPVASEQPGSRLKDVVSHAAAPSGEGFVECLIGTPAHSAPLRRLS